MASLLTSCNTLIMQNTPFNGAGRRPAPHPLLATFPSPRVIYLYTCFIRSVWNAYMLCSVRICKHSRESKSTCSRCTGGPGRFLAPLPLLRWRSRGGRGQGADPAHLCILNRYFYFLMNVYISLQNITHTYSTQSG